MDVTDCLELPYPECDPPLTKDASDIIQFKALADATDAAVQELSDEITDTLTNPDYVMMTGGSNTAGNDVIHALGAVLFDNGGLGDTVADRIVIQEDGWYKIGGYVTITTAPGTSNGMRVEPLLNGDPFTSRQGPGWSLVSEYTGWSDVGFFRQGDQLNVMTHHFGASATVFTYVVHMWALQIAVNV